MRTSRFMVLTFVALCCLLMSQRAHAQNAYGYATISHDGSTVMGYASSEVDYETAYYYDAEVQAEIQDENGNVLAFGSGSGNPSAFTFLDVIQAAACIKFSIIGYVITTPRFLGCNGGYFDYWGFSDYWWGSWWDYGDFFGSRQTRCIFTRLIFIATIIADVIRCLPAEVNCQMDNSPEPQILPSGLGDQTEYIEGLDPNSTGKTTVTITCHAQNPVTGGAQSGVQLNFGFQQNPVKDDGGHQNHLAGVARPLGSYSRTTGRTDNNGNLTSVYTAPEHSGEFGIQVSSPDTNETLQADVTVKVPNFTELAGPTGNDGYVLTGSDTYHPSNHWGKPSAIASLRQIGIDYRDTLFPEATNPNGVPGDRVLRFNDVSLKWGGKFDIPLRAGDVPRWRTLSSHGEHRVGINCDISDVTIPNDTVTVNGQQRNRWQVVEEIFANNGSSRTNREHCRNHWHVRFENKGGNNPTEGCTRSANPNFSTPADGVAAGVPGRVEVERYDDDVNIAGSFRPNDGGAYQNESVVYSYPVISPIPGGSGEAVSMIGGQWQDYTVDVASGGSYTFEARVASPYSNQTFHIELDGADVTGGLYIPNTGSYTDYQFVSIENIWVDGGRHVISIKADGWGQEVGNFDYLNVNPYVPIYYCDPPWWEINNCHGSGGYWDYGYCACNWGGYWY